MLVCQLKRVIFNRGKSVWLEDEVGVVESNSFASSSDKLIIIRESLDIPAVQTGVTTLLYLFYFFEIRAEL